MLTPLNYCNIRYAIVINLKIIAAQCGGAPRGLLNSVDFGGFQRFSVGATRDWNGGYNCWFLQLHTFHFIHTLLLTFAPNDRTHSLLVLQFCFCFLIYAYMLQFLHTLVPFLCCCFIFTYAFCLLLYCQVPRRHVLVGFSSG